MTSFFKDVMLAKKESWALKYVFERNPEDDGHLGSERDVALSAPSLWKLLFANHWRKKVPVSDAMVMVPTHPRALPTSDNEIWFFINGIMTDVNTAIYTASVLSDMFNRTIHTLYNPTNGLIPDLAECVMGRTFDNTSEIALQHVRIIEKYIKPGVTIRIIGHSQGGIIGANIVEELQRVQRAEPVEICFHSFAGAQDELTLAPGNFAEHFANDRDYVAILGIIRKDTDIDGVTYVRTAVGHLLLDSYLEGFVRGDYCNKESVLWNKLVL